MKKTPTYTQDQVDLAKMSIKIDNIEVAVNTINTKLEKEYVTQEQFAPIKSIVYGMVALILTGVVGALLALIIKQ